MCLDSGEIDEKGKGSSRSSALPLTLEDVEHGVLAVCSRLIGGEGIRLDDDLADAGATSLTLILIATQIQGVFSVQFEPTSVARVLFSTPTPRGLASYIYQRKRDSVLRCD